MSFSGKLSANLTNASRTLSQKAKNFSDTNALQREMNAEKRNIQQKYAEIGQLYYEKFRDDPGADFFAEIESITASTKRIEEIQGEIQDVQARKPELVQVPVDPPKGDAQPSAMVCMQCGCTYDASQTFCSACGQKLVPQFPSAPASHIPAQVTEDVQQTAPSLTKPADIVLPEEAAPAQEEDTAARPRFCTKCGAKENDDSLFCALCGNKLPE